MRQISLFKYLEEFSQGGRYISALDVLPYHKPYNFFAAERNGGKTTAVAGLAIGLWIFKKKKFIYTRRKKDETLLTCKSFFEQAAIIAGRVLEAKIDVVYKGGCYYMSIDSDDPAQFGQIVPLSMEYKYKSYDFSEYNLIVYDEFLTDPRKEQRYLGGSQRPDAECVAMLSLYQTVDRGIDTPFRNETTVFFLGNTATIYNPFFLQYGVADELQRNPGARIIAPKQKPWLLYQPHVAAVAEGYESSNVKALSLPEDEAYSRGRGIDDDTFIEAREDATRPIVNVIIKGVRYGVYCTDGYETIYICQKPSAFKPSISVDTMGHDGKVDMFMVKSWQSTSELNFITDAYLHGRARFQNGKVKQSFLNYLNFMPN